MNPSKPFHQSIKITSGSIGEGISCVEILLIKTLDIEKPMIVLATNTDVGVVLRGKVDFDIENFRDKVCNGCLKIIQRKIKIELSTEKEVLLGMVITKNFDVSKGWIILTIRCQ